MSVEQRIEQFRQMTEADPENELGHFSLGRAYVEAERHAEAATCFERVLEINPRMSKAYQLLGEAQYRSGNREKAVSWVTRGVTVADAQGDRMPRDAMLSMLKEWGAAVPTLKSGATPVPESGPPSESGFRCTRCGRPGGQLAKIPFKGELGERIHRQICNSCWREWIGMGTKVINELGLQLSSKAGQDAYDQYMVEYLQLEQT